MTEKKPSLFFSVVDKVKWVITGKSLDNSAAGQKASFSKFKKIILIGSLAAAGYLTYLHIFGNKVEIICMETEGNLKLTRKITELRTQKYNRSALLPFRFMEIVYGNMYDNREYCEYKREVVYDPEGENIALGSLIRLGGAASGHRP